MKKIIVLLVLLMALAGCGGSGPSMKKAKYYEEMATLPTLDSVTSANYSSNSKTSISGEVTKIEYWYDSADLDAVLTEYAEYCNANGLSAITHNEKMYIVENNIKNAVLTKQGEKLLMSILPENMRHEMMEPQTVKIGEKISLDFVTITLSKKFVKDTLKPHNTSGVYMYLSDVSGSKYVYIKGKIKNLSTVDIDSDYVKVNFCINDKYNYDGELIITANPASTTDYAITPMESSHCFFYASIPNDAVNSMETCVVTISFNKDFARGEETQYTYTVPFK